MPVMVKCDNCKKEFPSGIQTDSEKSLKAMKIKGNQETCPHCKKATLSGNQNMRFKP